ncbi:MAG: hypothetical protein IMZ52_10030 [Actinobacteria bacterium]|nr:hypothetical protein [Actinomycetota bacterium]
MKLLRLRKDQKAIVFELLIAGAMAIIMLFALMNIGAFINGTVSDSLTDTFPAAASRSELQNRSVSALENISTGFDSTINIMVIAAIITVITIPLAAVVAIKQLM